MIYKTINISPEYKKAIKTYAAEHEKTIKAVVEELIVELIAKPQTQFVE